MQLLSESDIENVDGGTSVLGFMGNALTAVAAVGLAIGLGPEMAVASLICAAGYYVGDAFTH